jgi:hypothetical protein
MITQCQAYCSIVKDSLKQSFSFLQGLLDYDALGDIGDDEHVERLIINGDSFINGSSIKHIAIFASELYGFADVGDRCLLLFAVAIPNNSSAVLPIHHPLPLNITEASQKTSFALYDAIIRVLNERPMPARKLL